VFTAYNWLTFVERFKIGTYDNYKLTLGLFLYNLYPAKYLILSNITFYIITFSISPLKPHLLCSLHKSQL